MSRAHIIQLLSGSNLSGTSINQPTSITTLVASQKQATLEAILAAINSVPTATRWCENGKGECPSSLDTPVALIGQLRMHLPHISPARHTVVGLLIGHGNCLRDNSSTYQVTELLRRHCQMHYI